MNFNRIFYLLIISSVIAVVIVSCKGNNVDHNEGMPFLEQVVTDTLLDLPSPESWRFKPIKMYIEKEEEGWVYYALEFYIENGDYPLYPYAYHHPDYAEHLLYLSTGTGVVHTEEGVDYEAHVQVCDFRAAGGSVSNPFCLAQDSIFFDVSIPPRFRIRGQMSEFQWLPLVRFRVATAATPSSLEMPDFGTIDLQKRYELPKFPIDDSLDVEIYALDEVILMPEEYEIIISNPRYTSGELSIDLILNNPDQFRETPEIPVITAFVSNRGGWLCEISDQIGWWSRIILGPGIQNEYTLQFNCPAVPGDTKEKDLRYDKGFGDGFGPSGSTQYLIIEPEEQPPLVVKFIVP